MEIIVQIALIVIPIFMGGMGWLIKRVFNKLDEINKTLFTLATKEDVKEAKKDTRREIDLIKNKQETVKVVAVPVEVGSKTVFASEQHI